MQQRDKKEIMSMLSTANRIDTIPGGEASNKPRERWIKIERMEILTHRINTIDEQAFALTIHLNEMPKGSSLSEARLIEVQDKQKAIVNELHSLVGELLADIAEEE